MPLEPGKSQNVISRNIAVERHHGKPEKQAIAIAESNARRTGDTGNLDAQLAKAKRNLALAETHKEEAKYRSEVDELLHAMRSAKKTATDDLAPVGAEDPERAVALKRHEEGLTKSQDRRNARDGVKCQCESSVGCGHGGGPCGNTATRDVPTIYGGYKMCRTCAEALPAEYKKGSDMKRARDIQGSEIREKLGISEAEWAKLDKSARQDKAREALRRGKDEVMPVGDLEPREELRQLKEDLKKRGHLTSYESQRKRELEAQLKRSKDELPTAIKTSNLVPMPSGEHNEVSYAPRRIAARDRGRFKKVGDSKELREHIERLKKEPQSAMRDRLIKTAELAVKKGIPRDEAAREIARATDAIANLPLQTSGSEPADHMQRANEYEVAGDRARALDSYRAAASGYRKANDRANEAKARDGVEACQAKFSTQYQHPGAGRVKVCDSAEQAMRTAVERTRAGESVCVVGKTVRPERSRVGDKLVQCAGCGTVFTTNGKDMQRHLDKHPKCAALYKNGKAKDEHEGFKKLEGKLSHEKGVTNPAALAASIGRKKYGAEGMAKKSASARDDGPDEEAEARLDAYTKFRHSLNRMKPSPAEQSKLDALWRAYKEVKARVNRFAVRARDGKEVRPV